VSDAVVGQLIKPHDTDITKKVTRDILIGNDILVLLRQQPGDRICHAITTTAGSEELNNRTQKGQMILLGIQFEKK
jgi:hypothetical protein